MTRRHWLALIRLFLLCGLLCFCVLAAGLQMRWNRARAPYAHSPPTTESDPATELPFLGATVALEQYGVDAAGAQQRRAALNRLQSHGFGWVRQRFDWAQLEPEPGQFDWRVSDALLVDIAASGLEPVVVLDGSPAWARAAKDTGAADNPLAPPADVATFARFAARFAQRYGDVVRIYQVWDEPNLAPHWGNRLIEPVAYAGLLHTAGSAIRHADADAVIVMAALAPTVDRGHTAIDEVYFLQRMYAAAPTGQTVDAPHRLFDIVAVQPFGFATDPVQSTAHPARLNFQRAVLARRVMVAAGDGDTPVWAVRYGWNRRPGSPWSTVTPDQQATFAIQALEMAYTDWPWLTALGWVIDRPAAPTTDPAWGFALNDSLLAYFAAWSAQVQPRASPAADIPVRREPQPEADGPWRESGAPLLLWGVVGAGIAWRGWRAARLLPWSEWRMGFDRAPAARRFLAWGLVIGVYYLAVWPPLVGLCLIGASLLNLAQPLVGLGLAALLLPFHFYHKAITVVDVTWHLAPAHALLLSLAPALLLARRNRPIRPRAWDGLAVAWLVISLLTWLNVWHRAGYVDGLFDLVLMPLLAYVATRVWVTNSQQQRWLLAALFAGGLLAALVGLNSWARGSGVIADTVRRLVGPHFSPNHTALYLERTLFVGLGVAFAYRSVWRGAVLAGCAVVLLALLLTASRGAWLLGLPAGFCVWTVLAGTSWRGVVPRLERRIVRRWLRLGCVGLGLLGVALVLFLFRERLLNSATVWQRVAIWRATGDLWLAHPLLGVGPGGFFWRYPAYVLTEPHLDPNLRHPHNLWLEHAALWGAAGLIWLVAALALGARTFLHRLAATADWQRGLWIGVAAGLGAGLAHGQVDAFATLADVAGWNWLAWGVVCGAAVNRENK